MTTTTDQWMMMQFYNHQSPEEDDLLQASATMEGLIYDATNNNNHNIVTSSSSPSPTSPKAVNNNVSTTRPIRRRSRASKRTPTTLLNANTTNFRALVQQFTGCPSSTAMSFEVYKGPITLNFKQGSRQVLPHQQYHHNKSRTTVTTVSSTAPAPMGNTGFTSNGDHHISEHQYQQQQQWDQQKSFDDNLFDDNSDLLFLKPGSMELSDHGMIMDHNFSLHDMTMDNAFFSSNNEAIQHGNTCYM